SSFRAYAVDGNGDGQRNLWNDWEDIFASVANYLAVHGWRSGAPVADPIELTDAWSGHEPENGMNLDYTVASLEALGYALPDGRDDTLAATALAMEAPGGGIEYWV